MKGTGEYPCPSQNVVEVEVEMKRTKPWNKNGPSSGQLAKQLPTFWMRFRARARLTHRNRRVGSKESIYTFGFGFGFGFGVVR